MLIADEHVSEQMFSYNIVKSKYKSVYSMISSVNTHSYLANNYLRVSTMCQALVVQL